MSIGDLVRYIVVGAIVLALGVFGMKIWKKQKLEKTIVKELRTLANPTASFEQAFAEQAEAALLKSMAYLYEADSKLGKNPTEILLEVFHGSDNGALFGKVPEGRETYGDPKAELIRDGLLRNYQHCITLGLFKETESLQALQEGKAPRISSGPASGGNATISHIIDPDASAGMEKLIPNMVISPPNHSHDKPTDTEIRLAKELASDLFGARLIERDAEERILNHYDQFNAPPPEPEPEPEPQPEPEPEPKPTRDRDKPKEDEDECPFGEGELPSTGTVRP